MSDPGGERQDPRVKVWVLLDRVGAAVGAALDVDTAREFRDSIPEARGWREFYVPASSVPVGGAPREKVAEAIAEVLVGEGVTFRSRAPVSRTQAQRFIEQVTERLTDVAMRGAPRDDQIAETVRLDPDRVRDVLDARDDQNDAGETLANTCGLFQEIRREIAISGRELEGEALAKWMDQRWPQFAEPGALSAASTKSSSGVAPKGDEWRAGYQAGRMETLEVVQNSRIGFPARKGEQEEVDESSASWQNGYNVGFEHAKVASPPPDRLTPEELDVIRDRRYSNEFVGNLIRAKFGGPA